MIPFDVDTLLTTVFCAKQIRKTRIILRGLIFPRRGKHTKNFSPGEG